MERQLIERIKTHANSQTTVPRFAPASQDAIEEAEQSLGFSIPALLRACYLTVGNGGFGPGYGIIGVEGGYQSDYGNIVETHALLKSDQESEGRRWQDGLLPFCEWGCNIFSCVDSRDGDHLVYTFEDFDVWPQEYSLNTFFELWINGVDILSYEAPDKEEVEITNPFTKKKRKVSKRKRG